MKKDAKQQIRNEETNELSEEQLDQVTGAMPADDGGEAELTDLTSRKAGGTQQDF